MSANDPQIYLLVRLDPYSPLLDQLEDRDVAYESIVMDSLNERFGEALGLEVVEVEMTDNTTGAIVDRAMELINLSPQALADAIKALSVPTAATNAGSEE